MNEKSYSKEVLQLNDNILSKVCDYLRETHIYDLIETLITWRQDPHYKIEEKLDELISMAKLRPLKYMITIKDISLRVNNIFSFKVKNEYNEDFNNFDYLLIINEDKTERSPNGNIVIKFLTENERRKEIVRLKKLLERFDIKFLD